MDHRLLVLPDRRTRHRLECHRLKMKISEVKQHNHDARAMPWYHKVRHIMRRRRLVALGAISPRMIAYSANDRVGYAAAWCAYKY